MTAAPAETPVTVVVGLGNPLRCDDAVGLRTAEAVARLLDAEPVAGARVVTSTRAGFELMDLLAGASRAIIVDCLELPDPEPGRVHLLSIDEVSGSTRLIGAHDVSVGEALAVARASGVPMPDAVDI
jgi:hydrogenase maturation protease